MTANAAHNAPRSKQRDMSTRAIDNVACVSCDALKDRHLVKFISRKLENRLAMLELQHASSHNRTFVSEIRKTVFQISFDDGQVVISVLAQRYRTGIPQSLFNQRLKPYLVDTISRENRVGLACRVQTNATQTSGTNEQRTGKLTG